ncbi:hypothetical protein Cgig2_019474 [Carnegiea gigantea]|uniref:Uncharacterized protein n=1 Tax=Carnegiea gigantea TaxID=171969 RepID=A0A9Q1QPD3_9CARY|nr:hypothetical protein Cgig2_019474 [Carnegiea gigantea]
MVVREGIGAEELLKMVREMIGSDMSEEKLWYSLKYDKEMLVGVEGDNDVHVFFKGNDEHGYMYVAGNAGPVKRPHVRKLMSYMLVCGNCRSLEVKRGELPASRLRPGGDTIEMSDDEEISVASEDAGDEEATKEDNAGDERAAEKQCGDGNKRKWCIDGNDVNDNVWPRSGMEARSYHRKLSIWKKFQDFVYVVCLTGLQFTVVMCATGLQFIVYPRHAAEIPSNLQAHTHCASVLYHGRHYKKPE